MKRGREKNFNHKVVSVTGVIPGPVSRRLREPASRVSPAPVSGLTQTGPLSSSDSSVRRLFVRTGLNEYELAVKLVQLVHLNP